AVFGMTATLGCGVGVIDSGLETGGVVPGSSFIYQVLIVAVLGYLSIISAVSGVDKGVRILSNINIVSVVVLLLFVLVLGPTVYLIGSFTEVIGHYINNSLTFTFKHQVID